MSKTHARYITRSSLSTRICEFDQKGELGKMFYRLEVGETRSETDGHFGQTKFRVSTMEP